MSGADGHGVEHLQVRNDMSGTSYGPSVQAGVVNGGIHFHVPALPGTDPDRVPDQLPARTVRFHDRVGALASLDRLLGADAVPVRLVGLSGMPGIGKTALAVEWAARAEDRFPGGRLYVDFAPLRARAGADVSAALGIALRGLGVAEVFLPDSLAERTEWFRQRSGTRPRMLVVLDGVSSAAQVRPLVPKGTGSVVLVTSRGRLDELTAFDGAHPVAVEPMDASGGVRILADRCGEDVVAGDPAAARRLVELCGGLPVAVQVAAARLLVNRGRLTVAALVEELEDETGRLAGLSLRGEQLVSGVFDLPYGDLPADTARVYRLLGWLPCRTFDVGTVAAAVRVAEPAAASRLAALEDMSLLERLPDGRFRMHDLVRLHARGRAEAEEADDEQRAVIAGAVTHYLVLTALADRAVRADRLRIAALDELLREVPDPFRAARGPQPLAWLEAERDAVLAVLRAASRAELHTEVWQLAESFTVLFLHRRHLGAWRESLEIGVAAAAVSTVPVPAAEARLRSLLSRPLMDLHEDEAARQHLERAAELAAESGNVLLQASVQEFCGRYWDRFDPARAVTAYRDSVRLNEEAGNARGKAIALMFLGAAQDAAGDSRAALATLESARSRLLAVRDERMAARALAAIGGAYDHLGETDAALRCLSDAQAALERTKATHYQAQVLVRLADIVHRTGGPCEDEQAYVARALAIHEQGGSPEAGPLRERLEQLGAKSAGDGAVER